MVAALEAGREKIRRIEAERERLHEGTGHVQQQLQALQDTLDQVSPLYYCKSYNDNPNLPIGWE